LYLPVVNHGKTPVQNADQFMPPGERQVAKSGSRGLLFFGPGVLAMVA
jgi:hypothetical protein